MTPRHAVLALTIAAAVLAGCAIALALSISRHRHRAERLATVQVTVDRLAALRQQHPVAPGTAADGELLARIQRALGQVGLPASTCTGVMPRGHEAQTAGAAYRRQVVSVTLGGLSITDLGGWLAAFRTVENPWRVTELQCVAGGLDRSRYAVSVLLASALPESAP